MKTHHGKCHCGAIRFSFDADEINKAIRCNCSMCSRKGSVLTAFTVPPANMSIQAGPGAQQTYQFGTMTARHHFCGSCGVHTFVETRLKPGHFRVNLACVDGVAVYDLPETIFDGKSL
ncbi:MAG: GFA family protein [Boseongicola sp.]